MHFSLLKKTTTTLINTSKSLTITQKENDSTSSTVQSKIMLMQLLKPRMNKSLNGQFITEISFHTMDSILAIIGLDTIQAELTSKNTSDNLLLSHLVALLSMDYMI